MTAVVALFSPRGGVGTTTLAHHLAQMTARSGVRTLAVDLDPQADLTATLLAEDVLLPLWDGAPPGRVAEDGPPGAGATGHDAPPGGIEDDGPPGTVADAIASPGDRGPEAGLPCHEVAENLWAIAGDPGLAALDDAAHGAWPLTADALRRIVRGAADGVAAQLVVIDVAPSLGALARAAVSTADHVLVPLAGDLAGVRALATAGPVFRRWRAGRGPSSPAMAPIGYVVRRPVPRLQRPATNHDLLLPDAFARSLLGAEAVVPTPTAADPHCLANMRSYPSLMPLAQDARKPMFDLRVADGAIGSTAQLVRICFDEFSALADALLARTGIRARATTP